MQDITLLPITAACLSCFCRHEVQSQVALNTSLLGVCPHQCQGTHCLFCSCRSTGRAEAFMLLQKLITFSIPHLDSVQLFSSLAFAALWSLHMEASLRPQCKRVHLPQERPFVAQPQRKSRPGQCALLLELVMDKVSTVLISAPVGARDHDTVFPSCGLT